MTIQTAIILLICIFIIGFLLLVCLSQVRATKLFDKQNLRTAAALMFAAAVFWTVRIFME